MGQSTNGQICFGMEFEEGFEFPWDLESDGDIEAWWRDEIHGFKPKNNPFAETETGYRSDLDTEVKRNKAVKAYFQERRDFEETMPDLPVEMVNMCSGDYPVYILSSSVLQMSASRGYPQEIDLDAINSCDFVKMHNDIIDFCNAHDIEVPEDPKLYLSSYWG